MHSFITATVCYIVLGQKTGTKHLHVLRYNLKKPCIFSTVLTHQKLNKSAVYPAMINGFNAITPLQHFYADQVYGFDVKCYLLNDSDKQIRRALSAEYNLCNGKCSRKRAVLFVPTFIIAEHGCPSLLYNNFQTYNDTA